MDTYIQWQDEFKTNELNIKSNEMTLNKSYISSNFHLQKIYSRLLNEEKSEKKTLSDMVSLIKEQLLSVENQYKSNDRRKGDCLLVNKGNYIGFKEKMDKVNYFIQKARYDFRGLYDKLIDEETVLEAEMEKYEARIQSGYYNRKNEKEKNSKNTEDVSVKVISNENQPALYNTHNQSNDLLEETIQNILNNQIFFKSSFPEEKIKEYIDDHQYEVNELKDLIAKIDYVISKNLKSPYFGWNQRDHQEFIKVVNTYKYKIHSIEFYSALENAIPYIPGVELREHIKVYNKYFFINEIKKMIIYKYKMMKEESKEEKAVSTMNRIYEKNRKMKNEGENEKEEERKKKNNVDEWRRRKEEERKKKEEEMRKNEEEKKEKEKKRLMSMRKENQIKLEEYKKIKSDENVKRRNNKIETEEEGMTRQVVNEIDIERINERNNQLLERRLEAIRNRENMKNESNLKIERSYSLYKQKKQVELENVQTKLYENTELMNMKKREKFDFEREKGKDGFSMANNVLMKTNKKIPSWRKGL